MSNIPLRSLGASVAPAHTSVMGLDDVVSGYQYERSRSNANHSTLKTFQSKEEKEEEIGRTKVKEMGAMGPLTVGELAATTGGGEQNIIVTPSKIRFETIAYANMWPRNRPNTEESRD